MKQYIADAFTDHLFGGNPAAVLPCREMPPAELMQSIAIENNYSETAFVLHSFVDPVTGSAHTYLAPFWAKKLGKREMTAKQISRRGGVLKVSVGDSRVYITGKAVLYMQGDVPDFNNFHYL